MPTTAASAPRRSTRWMASVATNKAARVKEVVPFMMQNFKLSKYNRRRLMRAVMYRWSAREDGSGELGGLVGWNCASNGNDGVIYGGRQVVA